MRICSILIAGMAFTGFRPTAISAQECPPPVERVSVSAGGEEGNHNSFRGDPSSGGVYVGFETAASNLLPGDDNDDKDVVLKNIATGELELISVALDGGFANHWSAGAMLECQGRIVAFRSFANDLVDDDTNGVKDAFVRYVDEGFTTRISVSSTGEQANDESDVVRISGDGGSVAFTSWASNLVPDDTNGMRDVFVHELSTGETTRISVSTTGEQGLGHSYNEAISFDGRYVAFESLSPNLVPGDTNSTVDIFVHDRETGETVLVSVSALGLQGNGWSSAPGISGDGSYVSFSSWASNLIPGDTNLAKDIFVVEWRAFPPVIERVSVSSSGEQGNDYSSASSISDDGRMVIFHSRATNLVPGGASGQGDFYVHDRWTGVTRMVSSTQTGEWANGWSPSAGISCDGLYVAFTTDASNIVPGDTNGRQDVFLRALDVPLLHPGDVDCDGDVDPFDLALLLGNWGPCPEPCTPGEPPTCPADFDHDCTVGPFDLAFLLGNWGP